MKVVIHIGKPRCGSTFLQNFFFKKIKSINYLGKTYQKYPSWLKKLHYLDDYYFEINKQNLKKEIYENLVSHKINLISSESFSLWGGGWYNQILRIKSVFNDPTIILIIRNPLDLINSYINYLMIKKEITKPLDPVEFRRTPYVFYKAKPVFLPDFYYDEQIKFLKKNFSKVLIIKFENLIKSNKKELKKITKLLEYDLNKIDIDLSIKINSSLSEASSKYILPKLLELKIRKQLRSKISQYFL